MSGESDQAFRDALPGNEAAMGFILGTILGVILLLWLVFDLIFELPSGLVALRA